MRRSSSLGASTLWVRLILIILILLAFGLRIWRLDVLPPGLYFDEAFDGWDARRIAFEGYHPVYFAANNGREPLFIYLSALSVRIFGPTAYALRLVSALAGTLTVPAVYVAARAILRLLADQLHDRTKSPFIAALPALVATAAIVVSYWHLSLSRLAFRVVLLPLLSALAMAWFWRAWHGRRRRDYVWSGALFALALNAYISARFLPFVVSLFVLTELIGDLRLLRSKRAFWWERWRPRLQGLGILLAVNVLLLTPLIGRFVRSPDLLSARISGISVFSALPEEMPSALYQRIGHNLTAVAGSFYVAGDQNLRHNLPGRPVNDPFLALLFTVGWLAALYRIKQSWARLLLIWLAVMLLPTILSTPAPHALRSAGVLPPLALLYGVGASTIVLGLLRLTGRRWLTSERPLAYPRTARYASLALFAGIVAISGTWTTIDYFHRWARLPALGRGFNLDAQLAAEQAARLLQDGGGKPILVSSDLYQQPQMAYALGKAQLQSSIPQDVIEAASSALPVLHQEQYDQRQPMYLVWKDGDIARAAWLDPLKLAADVQSSQGSDTTWSTWPVSRPDWPRIGLSLLADGVELQPRQIRYPLDVSFANGVKLLGYNVEPDAVRPGEQNANFRLTLFWETAGASEPASKEPAITADTPRGDFMLFSHLIRSDGVWQTRDDPIGGEFLLPWHDWLGAQTPVEDVRILAVPPNMPPGKAHFEIGLYRVRPDQPDPLERIPVVNAQDQPVADQVELGAIMIGDQPPAADLSGLTNLGVEFDHHIELTGWRAVGDAANPRQVLVDLGWKALDRPTTDYTAFVHLIDNKGQIITQHDAPPGGQENPTRLWAPGETVRSSFILKLPEGVNTAGTRLRIGLYEPVGGKQLPVMAAADRSAAIPGDIFILLPGDVRTAGSQ